MLSSLLRCINQSTINAVILSEPAVAGESKDLGLKSKNPQAVILSEGGLPRVCSSAGNPSRRILVCEFK